jgi:hypothetical protein
VLTHNDPDDAKWEVVTYSVGRLIEDPEPDSDYIEGRDKSQHNRPLTPYYSTEDSEFSTKYDRAVARLDRIKTKELATQSPDYDHNQYTCLIKHC